MDKLLDELLFMIFEYLDIIDLLNKKAVCKRWYYLIDSINFKELIIKDNNQYCNDTFWHYLYKPINLNNTIWLNELDNLFFDNQQFKNHFINLKNLKINLDNHQFNLEQLNQFQQLEHLNINYYKYLKKDTILNLPKLRILQIVKHSEEIHQLILNSNQLEILELSDLKCVTFGNPKTIKYIDLKSDDKHNLEKYLNLERFSNLNIFKFNIINSNQKIKFDLFNLPNIKQIHLSCDGNLLESWREIVNSFLNQKQSLNKTDLKIFFKSIELSDRKPIDDYGFFDDYQLNLIHKNYNQLDNKLSSFTYFNYKELVEKFQMHLPDSFFSKFNNIQLIISSGKIENQNHFLWFLSNCPNLIYLNLKSPNLNQEFYDKLSFTNLHLNDFHLEENDNLKLNYSFILKFKLLKRLKTNHRLSINLINDSLINLKFIDYLSFNGVWIYKTKQNVFKLKYCNDELKNLRLNEVVNLCKNLV